MGSLVRQLISKAYEEEMIEMNLNEDKEITLIPNISSKSIFNLILINQVHSLLRPQAFMWPKKSL